MTTRTPDADAPDDEGSVLLLTLGYALLAIALVLVCVDATSLYLTQKRADAAADAAALAGGRRLHPHRRRRLGVGFHACTTRKRPASTNSGMS